MNRKEICEHVGKIITGDRNQTHGDPFEQFECAQELKAVANNYIKGRPEFLTKTEMESLSMILLKVSRIINGNPIRDHWDDIIGYAAIAAESREKEIELKGLAKKYNPSNKT